MPYSVERAAAALGISDIFPGRDGKSGFSSFLVQNILYYTSATLSAQLRPHRRMVLSDICFQSVTDAMNRCINGSLTCRNSPFPILLSCKIYYISIRYTCTSQSVILSDICFQSVTGSMNWSSTGPCNQWIGGLVWDPMVLSTEVLLEQPEAK